jgi:hypothetical protein
VENALKGDILFFDGNICEVAESLLDCCPRGHTENSVEMVVVMGRAL